jgi:hypothetical protein
MKVVRLPALRPGGYSNKHIIIIIIITYLPQLSFHSVTVILTLVQAKQIRIDINETIQHSTNNTKHSKYCYTFYQNTHTIVKNAPTYTHPHIHKKLKQSQYKIDRTVFNLG